MAQLRVMSVINGLGTGGAERSLAEMLPYLRDGGIDVHIVCSYQRPQGVENDVLSDGFRVTYLKRRSFLARLLELRRLIRSEKPDIVHTTIIESDILGRLAAVGSGIPVLTSLVNTSYDPVRFQDPNLKGWKLEAVRLVDGFTARHFTTAFHAISEAVANDAANSLGIAEEQVTVIGRAREQARLGVVTQERRLSIRDRLGFAAEDQLVIAVGRQEWQKGQIVLVEAAALLRESLPDLKLLLVGREGSETPDIKRRITELELGGRILALGHRDDVPDLLAASDLFAFPSRFEGLGGSLLEALAMGIPCVASDIPVLREVGGAQVLYAQPGDASEWADSISRALSDPGQRAISPSGSNDIESVTRDLAAMYFAVVEGNKAANL